MAAKITPMTLTACFVSVIFWSDCRREAISATRMVTKRKSETQAGPQRKKRQIWSANDKVLISSRWAAWKKKAAKRKSQKSSQKLSNAEIKDTFEKFKHRLANTSKIRALTLKTVPKWCSEDTLKDTVIGRKPYLDKEHRVELKQRVQQAEQLTETTMDDEMVTSTSVFAFYTELTQLVKSIM